ncbi:hypothetical protein R1sor_024556 [Riccia sorocarpa]|uniref:Reverse transcriptase domain-containing protein n=1 Tax=Riccia sorocarpa TaxID=122646 RepID=A0ABD3GQU3_9MARC
MEADAGRLPRVPVQFLDDPLPVTTAFADATTFLVRTEPVGFQNLLQLLETFGEVSGCFINWPKTKHVVLGKYVSPPDWLVSLPFASLLKSQGTRYLGIFIGNKVRPGELFEFAAKSLRSRLGGFAGRQLTFEAKLIILRYLLQAMLPYSLALIRLRLEDFSRLERLMASFLWGETAEGRAKTSLVAWSKVALPLGLGGAGVWSLRGFQRALVSKLVFNSLIGDCPVWNHLLWGGLQARVCLQEVSALFLLDGSLHRPLSPYSNFMFKACLELRDYWRIGVSSSVIGSSLRLNGV